MLEVPRANPIRVWRLRTRGSIQTKEAQHGGPSGTISSSYLKRVNESSSAVSLTYFDASSPRHELWTKAGLIASTTSPPWYLSLKELVFNESDEIGKGSFGTVYKGSWLDTPVMIKFMGYEEDFDTISTDLLLHEVRVWHRLNHPHVLKLYGACHIDKRYFVCEYASRGNLTEYLKNADDNYQQHMVWQKMYEAALGLQYLHGQNVAHNDLKCDNIMVGMDGKTKVIDFGLSCLLNEAKIQVDVKKIGAVNWRSLEYLADERPLFASDVYSFAMCIIEAASGGIPWGKPMVPAQVRFLWSRGKGPSLPDSMSEKQRNLVRLMTHVEPAKRVRMAFVVDKLGEIAEEVRINLKAP